MIDQKLSNVTRCEPSIAIGVSTLDVLARHTDRYDVVGLAAGSNIELLAEQILKFQRETD